MLDEKTRAALDRSGAKKILADFMNVWHPDPQVGEERLNKFRDQNGPLLARGEVKLPFLAKLMLDVAHDFATAQDVKTVHEAEAINELLDRILGIDVYKPFLDLADMPDTAARPAIRADFLSGKWEPIRRTLLDVLAIELMRSRKALHRCERPECQRYFVKEFSRDRYCSNLCSEDMRRRGQSQSALNRRKDHSSRRKPKGKKKGRNHA